MSQPVSGYTLIELMAVVTLLTVAIGVVTLNVHGLSEESRLRGAADQVAACHQMARSEAARTGRPHSLVLTQRSCAIQRPVLRENEWQWEIAATFDVIPSVQFTNVGGVRLHEGEFSRVAVPAHVIPGRLQLVLRLGSGESALVILEPTTGLVETRRNVEGT